MGIRLFAGALGLALAIAAGCGGSTKASKSKRLKATGAPEVRVPKVNLTLCQPEGKRVRTADINRDGKPSLWEFYKKVKRGNTEVEALVCKQSDLNYDGKVNYIVTYYETGEIQTEEFDFGFVGHIDERHFFDKKTGLVVFVEADHDHDRKPDTWEDYNEKGEVESRIYDRNGDGKPDRWDQWENGRLLATLFDDDFDNRVNRKEVRETQAKPPAATQSEESSSVGESPPDSP